MMVHWSRAELDSAEKVMMMIGPFLLLGLLLPYHTRNAQKQSHGLWTRKNGNAPRGSLCYVLYVSKIEEFPKLLLLLFFLRIKI